MRLQNTSSKDEANQLSNFSQWIANIGDGTQGGPNDGESIVHLLDDILLKDTEDPIVSIVAYVYSKNPQVNSDPKFLQERVILAPTLDVVEAIIQYVISMTEGVGQTYLSSHNMCRTTMNNSLFQEIHTPEFLKSIRCSGVPNHELFLKVGTPVMLLRNIDHANGLCNGTRLVITRLAKHVLEATVLTGRNAGDKVLIPRMTLTLSDPRLPFRFQRRQFPVIVSYAMTINKSQGQSLSCVGLLLKKPVFTHGHLYVAVSRVINRNRLKIMICENEETDSMSTKNVVHKEVYRNL